MFMYLLKNSSRKGLKDSIHVTQSVAMTENPNQQLTTDKFLTDP